MSTITKLQEYKDFTQLLEKMMLVVGLRPVAKPTLFYRILPILVLSTCLMACSVIFNFIWTHHSNVGAIMRGMGLGTSFITTILKVLCIIINREEVYELHQTLSDIFNKLLIGNTEIQRDILERITIIRQLSITLSSLILLGAISFCVVPIIHIIYQYIHHIHPFNYVLALPAIYPWSISGGSFLYYCHFAFEIISGFSLFFVASTVDAFFPVYIFQITGQLKTMSHQLNNLKDDDDCDMIIRECVSKYRILMRCRDIIETVYGPIIMCMLLTSAIVLCAITFEISKMESFSIGRLCLLINYMGSKMLQTFIYTWSGSILTSESESFKDAIYASNWPGTGQKRFMSSILIMLTQKPLVITACSYCVVSIDMFAMILNTTISYFFLLKSIEGRAI